MDEVMHDREANLRYLLDRMNHGDEYSTFAGDAKNDPTVTAASILDAIESDYMWDPSAKTQ